MIAMNSEKDKNIQKYSKRLHILEKSWLVILTSAEPFHCLKRLSSISISSRKYFHWLKDP